MIFLKIKKFTTYNLVLITILILLVSLTSCAKRESTDSSAASRGSVEKEILHYTCGMHPDVRVSLEEYNKGNVNCPICNMKLIPVYKEEDKQGEAYYGCGVDAEGKCPHCDLGQPDTECICGEHSFIIEGQKINCPVCGEPLKELTQVEVDKLKGVVSRVKIKNKQIQLAGVKTEQVKKLHLSKEIRTVGKVAYDPQLAIAEEEFISSLKTFDKVQEGKILEIKERSFNLVESSKRKLRLLGLNEEQIKDLEKTRKIHTNLILPEEKMWIYGNVYEYELSWLKEGSEVKVTTSSLPGEVFSGIISSVNPVLDPRTRSVTFRAEVDNHQLELKPEMYVDVVIMSMYMSPDGQHLVLAIPKDAILDTGTRKIVWVYKGNEEYEGRTIEVGPEAVSVIDGKKYKFYPVLKGLSEDEIVVVKANFLIDSQSQISGIAAGAYGGALGAEEKKTLPVHQH